jgi:hypothetical protein
MRNLDKQVLERKKHFRNICRGFHRKVPLKQLLYYQPRGRCAVEGPEEYSLIFEDGTG